MDSAYLFTFGANNGLMVVEIAFIWSKMGIKLFQDSWLKLE